LPTLVDAPPEGDIWIHEIKYDGYRTEIVIERGEARAFTRNGHDWSAKYLPIVEAAAGCVAGRRRITASSSIVSTLEDGFFGPVATSATEVRFFRFETVFWLIIPPFVPGRSRNVQQLA
jgi:hypothetical protein